MTSPTGPSQDRPRTKDHVPGLARFEAAVAAYSKNRTEKNRVRVELAEARMYGLAQRHAAKLARNRSHVHGSAATCTCYAPALHGHHCRQ